MDTGKAIQYFQRLYDMSCVEVADKMGITPQQFNRYRKGKDLKLSTAIEICRVFDASMQEFLEAGS